MGSELLGFSKKVRTKNTRMAASFFMSIKDYSFLHHAHYMVDVVSAAIRLNVPGISDYICARCLTTKHMPSQI
jgi:hypothetical protein